jgi:hypothetical protein
MFQRSKHAGEGARSTQAFPNCHLHSRPHRISIQPRLFL